MTEPLSRRTFLARSASLSLCTFLGANARASVTAEPQPGEQQSFHTVDFHVHLDNSTIDKVLELSRERGIKFGIVEHAGTKQNQYPSS